jgi:hypothetical protein
MRLATKGCRTEESEFDTWYGQEVYLLHRVQSGCGTHPTPYAMGTEDSFVWEQRPGREAGHSPPTSAEENMNLYIRSLIRLQGVVLN